MIVCATCGTENPVQARFCKSFASEPTTLEPARQMYTILAARSRALIAELEREAGL